MSLSQTTTMVSGIICNSNRFLKWILLLFTILLRFQYLNSVSAECELSFVDGNKLYNYSLASPTLNFPHGILSEDGFYKVSVNETVLWFQLCDGMIFNHNPPMCVDCSDCGGPSRCGLGCSALVATKIEGYPVCTTIGRAWHTDINIIDEKKPHTGVIVKMYSSATTLNCSLSVSVMCDSGGIQGPHSLETSGKCDYSTIIRHPSGCANIVHVNGGSWGWFVTSIVVMFCLFGAYILAGGVYRFFVLGVRGTEVIPNLGFWTNLPQRTQSFVTSSVRKFRGPSHSYRSSYSPVNF